MQNETRGTAQELAQPFVNPEKGVETAEDALQGARDILAEQMSDDADVRKSLRALAMRTGVLESKNAGEEDSVYATYYDFSQEARNLPAPPRAGHEPGRARGLSQGIASPERGRLRGRAGKGVRPRPAA